MSRRNARSTTNDRGAKLRLVFMVLFFGRGPGMPRDAPVFWALPRGPQKAWHGTEAPPTLGPRAAASVAASQPHPPAFSDPQTRGEQPEQPQRDLCFLLEHWPDLFQVLGGSQGGRAKNHGVSLEGFSLKPARRFCGRGRETLPRAVRSRPNDRAVTRLFCWRSGPRRRAGEGGGLSSP